MSTESRSQPLSGPLDAISRVRPRLADGTVALQCETAVDGGPTECILERLKRGKWESWLDA